MSILNLSKKLLECNEYIAQLEEKNRLLNENINLTAQKPDCDARAKYEQRKMAYLLPIREMSAYISSTYEFRHNVVRNSYDYRLRLTDDDRMTAGTQQWQPIDERQLNTILSSVQDDGNVFCLKSLVVQRIKSEMASEFHPVTSYLKQLRGTWDGQDRVADLAARINSSDYCLKMLHVWLRAMVAQWMGSNAAHANAVMLLLVSQRQGLHKSTFMRELLPPELRDYYTDDFSLSSRGNAERKLVEFALVNIDEFDKLPQRRMPDLKTLMQTMRPSFVRAYKSNFNSLPRIASFVGTSNQRQLLTDRTGSRRFLILEPQDVINVADIDHRQLYAQLMSEVENGEQSYFTKNEERQMQLVNASYYVKTPLEQLFSEFFRAPRQTDDESEVKRLSATQLMTQLASHQRSILRCVSETTFGTMLHRMGIPREHTKTGNLYRVVAC